MRWTLFILGLLAFHVHAQQLKISEADRIVDISTQVIKVIVNLNVVNSGSSPVGEFPFYITKHEGEHLSYAAFTVDKKEAKIKSQTVVDEFTSIVIELPKKLATGASATIKGEYFVTQSLKPFPETIAQDETQFVMYTGNVHVSSAFPVATEKTTINFGSGKMQSFTTIQPSKQLGEKVVYGPYTNTHAKTYVETKIHYENVSPFLVAKTVERHIEISHWGNIAVEEKIQLVHVGAKLSGSFSRLDYQLDRRGKKQPCVKELKTILPSSAKDIYYRDVIGNISSSSVKIRAESVELNIRPRFPLFGGWKTNYVIGYNVPSYEYLFTEGNKFALKMRLLDHIFDEMVVEKLTTRIVLPEKATDAKLTAPYEVKRRPDEHLATYLDTEGRTVVVVESSNLVDEHIKEFVLEYNFQKTFIWREPAIAFAFFFTLFLAVIVYVRIDFDITKDATADARLALTAKAEILHQLLNSRSALHSSLIDVVAKYKENMKKEALETARSKINDQRAALKKKIGEIAAEMKNIDPKVADKLNEIETVESGVVSAETAYVENASKATSKNSPEDRSWASRVNSEMSKIDNILNSILA